MKLTIVSGGQTGAEQGALQAAIDLGLGTGGWRCAHDDGLAAIFSGTMRVTSSSDRGMARRLCVQDSDGTLAFSFNLVPLGVVAFAERTAEQQGKAWLHVALPAGAADALPESVRAEILEWIRDESIERLHVTGPGEDDAPGIQALVRRELVKLLEPIASEQLREFVGGGMRVLGELMDTEIAGANAKADQVRLARWHDKIGRPTGIRLAPQGEPTP